RRRPASFAEADETDRILDDRRLVVLILDYVRDAVALAPVGDPGDLFHRGRDEGLACDFAEAAGGEGEDGLALDGERSRVERHRVGSSGGERAELRETFRVVQHADD